MFYHIQISTRVFVIWVFKSFFNLNFKLLLQVTFTFYISSNRPLSTHRGHVFLFLTNIFRRFNLHIAPAKYAWLEQMYTLLDCISSHFIYAAYSVIWDLAMWFTLSLLLIFMQRHDIEYMSVICRYW